ncbi:hypothetical protein CRE_26274 [Caenorhabditis remanei]|uniref:Uncharacterized protein n=1 Tax=Caenorhabditis remanei TaxID=31234 RepID=E3LR43_CAERE|nr:hypothetical protein CRE_26274 [Caenorhabditis remanei]
MRRNEKEQLGGDWKKGMKENGWCRKREESHKMSEDQYYYHDSRYLEASSPTNRHDDNRESFTSGYHSSPRPPRTVPRDESPIPDTEPISVSEFSDAHGVPLFRTPPPKRRAQKEQKTNDDDDDDKQSYV